MTIAILQIGINRSFKVCEQNHNELYDIIKQRYGLKIYNHYKLSSNQAHHFNSVGKIQVHDFITHCENIEEDIIIKFRSDIFITKTAQTVILNELAKVVADQIDLVFLGTNIHNDCKETYKLYEDSRVCSRINDFVIIARKSVLPKYEDIKNSLSKANKDKSGNMYFHLIVKENTRSINVSTQIYLVRKEPKDPKDIWEIYHNWAEIYMYTATKQYNWVKDNKMIIRSF